MIFDSHTHINEDSYTKEQREELIREIGNAPLVSYVMDVGFDYASSVQAVKDANENQWCYAAVGIHPSDVNNANDRVLGRIKELALNEPKVKAIGEIGLDYHYPGFDKNLQKLWFRKQIRLAKTLNMPICIHSRDADGDTMDILKEEVFDKGFSKVLLHCFSGSAEMASEYIKLGGIISISGPVTYRNNKKTIKVVEQVPIEKMLVETDAPYLTPEPLRGKRNKTPYIEHTVRKIAEIKGLSFQEAAEITCQNAKKFYNI